MRQADIIPVTAVSYNIMSSWSPPILKATNTNILSVVLYRLLSTVEAWFYGGNVTPVVLSRS